MKKNTRLTIKQEAFIDGYMAHFNSAKAAKDAGYKGPDYNKAGFNILKSDAVKEEIGNRMQHRRESLSLVPFEGIISYLVEEAMNPDARVNERMKAINLLLKYQAANGWNADEGKQVHEYVDALSGKIGEVWD